MIYLDNKSESLNQCGYDSISFLKYQASGRKDFSLHKLIDKMEKKSHMNVSCSNAKWNPSQGWN